MVAKSPHRSPSHDDRPYGEAIRLIVVHNISLPPGEFGGPGVERLFTNTLNPAEHPYCAATAHMRLPGHLFVGQNEEVTQFVNTDEQAMQAEGLADVNPCSNLAHVRWLR